MANPNKAKGTKWEADIRDYMNGELGLVDAEGKFTNSMDPRNIRRQAQEGAADVGDLWAPPFILEAKNQKSISLSEYIKQAEAEAINAGVPFGAAVVKRRGYGTKDSYVVMSLAQFTRVLQYVRTGYGMEGT